VELHVVGRDITDRKRAEERQKLLINELNHRVKNTLAVVQSITHQTLRRASSDQSASEALEGRLAALSAAHDVLTRESWSSASMREIIQNGLKPFCSESRCTIEGPELRLNPRTAVSMALAIHELATNAAKYGALSTSDGRIFVSWAIADERLSFTWQERGGPPVEHPNARGFGSRLIERGLSAEFGGTAEMTFEASGLVFSFSSPVPAPE
jgi:two-component sensor histidine kinase